MRLAWWRDGRWWGLALLAVPVWWGMSHFMPLVAGWPDWRSALMLVLVAPLTEEVIFRLGLQDWLQGQRWAQSAFCGVSLANGMASLLFAAAHLWQHSPLWSALVLPPGLVFGWCYARWRSIWPGFALHASYNAGFLWLFIPKG